MILALLHRIALVTQHVVLGVGDLVLGLLSLLIDQLVRITIALHTQRGVHCLILDSLVEGALAMEQAGIGTGCNQAQCQAEYQRTHSLLCLLTVEKHRPFASNGNPLY